MTTLTLHSADAPALRPFVENALARELRLLELAVRRTEERVRSFEAAYQLPTDEFLRRYANDEFTETLDLDEWIGEARLLVRLQEKLCDDSFGANVTKV